MELRFFITGLNHRTAPVELREKIAFSGDEIPEVLAGLREASGLSECMLLSTCNRTEVYGVLDQSAGFEGSADNALKFIGSRKGFPAEELKRHAYFFSGEEAIRHLFRVTASLDSMILGEPQILGQVKEAFRISAGCGDSGAIINRLVMRAFKCAKDVRTNTGIGKGAVSVGYVAVELAKKIFGKLENVLVALIGAGKMGELAARHFYGAGASEVTVLNRSVERANSVASKFGWSAAGLDGLPGVLRKCDIVIASAGGGDYLITEKTVKPLMAERRYRQIFFIDIAVPRNIEPSVNNVENCFLYDIDDLQGVIAAHSEERRGEVVRAGEIIEKDISSARVWFRQMELNPTIALLRRKFMTVRDRELEKAVKMLGGDGGDVNRVVDQLTSSIVNKLLHDPIVKLKMEGESPELIRLIESLRVLFNLDEVGNAEEMKGNGK
ncbi:MAG: glutamyl-tRNA reductase [Deltaproteobacteria bacterium]|nr:glutamyl-tRNA reductase [Deltaproteobacteria bacterium]